MRYEDTRITEAGSVHFKINRRRRLAGTVSLLITELGHQVGLAEQLELLPFHLQLGPAVLRQENLVTHGDRHGDGGSGL